MAYDDEYELAPRKELESLRQEVDRLKRYPLGDTKDSQFLLDAINRLNKNLERMNEVLVGANDEMVRAFNDTAVHEQMRKILDQNEKLARGIVAVAELVKQTQRRQPSEDTFVARPTPAPQQSIPTQQYFTQPAPQPMPQPGQYSQEVPAPPPGSWTAPEPQPRPFQRQSNPFTEPEQRQ